MAHIILEEGLKIFVKIMNQFKLYIILLSVFLFTGCVPDTKEVKSDKLKDRMDEVSVEGTRRHKTKASGCYVLAPVPSNNEMPTWVKLDKCEYETRVSDSGCRVYYKIDGVRYEYRGPIIEFSDCYE